ncbi:MAG: hypothetical protein J5854_05330 [Clostridia bacterium]|nr:hypothetical protein [Clostridia bacterium]
MSGISGGGALSFGSLLNNITGFGGGVTVVTAVVLVLVSAVHLVACCLHRDGLRKPTKVFLVPLIICLHISICGFKYPLLILGLIFGWLGDIFLIPKDRKLTFVLGAFFFMIGHACYIWNDFKTGLPQAAFAACGRLSVLIAMLAVVAVGFTALWVLRKRISRGMLVVFMIYMLALLSMAGILVYSMLGTRFSAASVMISAGAVLFALSDFLLGAGIARAFKIKNNRFFVMLTYILAQTGIAVGFALL